MSSNTLESEFGLATEYAAFLRSRGINVEDFRQLTANDKVNLLNRFEDSKVAPSKLHYFLSIC